MSHHQPRTIVEVPDVERQGAGAGTPPSSLGVTGDVGPGRANPAHSFLPGWLPFSGTNWRRRRDLRVVRTIGILPLDVDALDPESLHQLATWVRIPRIWLASVFGYMYSAVIVMGAIVLAVRAGWWPEIGWLPAAGGAIVSWLFLGLPLMIGFSVLEERIDADADPFLRFGKAGSNAIRAVGMIKRSQLRRRISTLASLRQWQTEGTRLGVDVEVGFQQAISCLGSTQPTAQLAATVRSVVIPALLTTAAGVFIPAKFPVRRRPSASRAGLIKTALGLLGAPAVVALIQVLAVLMA